MVRWQGEKLKRQVAFFHLFLLCSAFVGIWISSVEAHLLSLPFQDVGRRRLTPDSDSNKLAIKTSHHETAKGNAGLHPIYICR